MKRFSIEALALAALLAGCGKEGDPTCKEGEYLVNNGLGCCPVGTEFKAGLCDKPAAPVTTTVQQPQTPTTATVTPEPPTPTSQPTTPEPPTTQANQPPPPPPVPSGPPDISGDWLFSFTVTSDCSSVTKENTIGRQRSLAKSIVQTGTSIEIKNVAAILPDPNCDPVPIVWPTGTIGQSGVFAASVRTVEACQASPVWTGSTEVNRAMSVTTDTSYSGKLLASGDLAGSRTQATTLQYSTIIVPCTMVESFTATK